ncbi:MAG: nuclear transport factor 2 family protein [Woeseiaceae bacterium]|nr:nuclear transport factor 2 family protein [Woeseiaceae bacterium]
MMRLVTVALLVLMVVVAVVHANDDERILRQIKTVLWPQAYRTQNVELLDTLLHDSFQMIDAGGNRSNKAAELAYVRDNAWDPGEFDYVIERLDIYDDRFAIIDGRGVASDYTYASSNVLIKEDGRWRAIASHVSGYEARDAAD